MTLLVLLLFVAGALFVHTTRPARISEIQSYDVVRVLRRG